MVWARLIADLIVIVHAGYVLFVVLGLVAILLGLLFQWRWIRNFWFRVIHLAMIGAVVAEEVFNIRCPLTVWENQFRARAGQASYPGDFLGYWAHRLIFYRAEPWVFTTLYVLTGLVIMGAFVLAPPQWPRRMDRRATRTGRFS